MPLAYCTLSIVPVRSEPSGKSSLVNQLLFGDKVQILEEHREWLRVMSLHDNYEGWCEKNQLDSEITGNNDNARVLVDTHTATFTSGVNTMVLVYGSEVQKKDERYFFSDGLYDLVQGSVTSGLQFTGENILNAGMKLKGSPYLWGGRSPFGIDCSGLIQIAHKINGVSLPRDAWQQAEFEGDFIDLIAEALPGDIAFFDNEEGRIVHTGILDGKGNILHASGKVRIDMIDHHGIFNKETGSYSHKLRIIKRYLKG